MMIEDWLVALGGVVTDTIHNPTAVGGGLWGYGRWRDLRLRYSWEVVHIGWGPSFDRWANSVDWCADVPPTREALKSVLMRAQALGEAGDRHELHDGFVAPKIEPGRSDRP